MAQQQQLMAQMQQMQMAAMQQLYLQQMIAANPAMAQYLPPPFSFPTMPSFTPLSMVGHMVSITAGDRAGETATIAGVNDHSFLLKLKDGETDIVKKFHEVSLLHPTSQMMAAGLGMGGMLGLQGMMQGMQAMGGMTGVGGAASSVTSPLHSAQMAVANPVSQATEINSPSSAGQGAGASSSSLQQQLSSPSSTSLPPHLPAHAGPPLPFPFFPVPGYFLPPHSKLRPPHLTKQRSLKNLVGKYVQVLSGPYKGEMGVVLKGSNGYFSVRLSRSFADLKEHGGVVMKRSGDLKVLDLTQASFELMKQQMRDEEARNGAAAAGGGRLLDTTKVEVGGDDSSSDDDDDDDGSDDDDDSDSDSDSESDVSSSSDDERKDAATAASASSSAAKKRKRSPSASAASHKKQRAAAIASNFSSVPIPAHLKPDALVDSLVVVKKGRCKGEVGTVRKTGHGFYALDIIGRGQVMKRANELEMIAADTTGKGGQAGGGAAGKSAMLTPRRLGKVTDAVRAAVAKSGGEGGVKGAGMGGNLRDAASLLMDLMGEGGEDGDAKDDDDDDDQQAGGSKKSKKTAATPSASKKKDKKSSSSSSSSSRAVSGGSLKRKKKSGSSASAVSGSKKRKGDKKSRAAGKKAGGSSSSKKEEDEEAEDEDEDAELSSSDSEDDDAMREEGGKRKAAAPPAASDTEDDMHVAEAEARDAQDEHKDLGKLSKRRSRTEERKAKAEPVSGEGTEGRRRRDRSHTTVTF